MATTAGEMTTRDSGYDRMFGMRYKLDVIEGMQTSPEAKAYVRKIGQLMDKLEHRKYEIEKGIVKLNGILFRITLGEESSITDLSEFEKLAK